MPMKKNRSNLLLFVPLLLGVSLAIGILIGGKLHFSDSPEPLFSTNSKKDKLNRLIDFIDHAYVDDVNTDSIVDVTVNDILEKLDPHSVYIPRSEMQGMTESMKGDFVGIGIRFQRVGDTVTVVRPIEGGPSERQGIISGDKILLADGDTLYGKRLSNDELVGRLKGPEGSQVELIIYRPHNDRILKRRVTRGHVPIKSVESSFMLDENLGYIKLNRFAESTYSEFKEALYTLQAQGASKLVLDLRDNPGGYLGVAEKLADEFLGGGKLILFTRNKKGEVDKVYASDRGSFQGRPIYVLINERSASASEIIAGALQDNDAGTIVGRRSFGKGLVQREMDLGDGSAVRLTVSRYYTPTGRSIQRSYSNGHEDYYQDFMQRYYNGELNSVDSIKVADSLKFVTPKGKIVYGGGGIIPDVFVPIGSLDEEKVKSMDSSEFFSNFVFNFLERDRSRFYRYPEYQFLEEFRVDDIIFEQFIDFVLYRNISLDFYGHEEMIKEYIRAGFAEQLYSPDLGAKIKSAHDRMLQEVMRIDREVTSRMSSPTTDQPSF